MADRDPWIKFYPKDYLSDLELATCSAAAQGVYMRLLCLMHISNVYGFVLINGAIPSTNALAVSLQIRSSTVSHCVTELLAKGVVKQDENGVLYSKRMLSDRAKRKVMSERGKLGGNPALLNRKDKPEQIQIQIQNKNKKEESEVVTSDPPLFAKDSPPNDLAEFLVELMIRNDSRAKVPKPESDHWQKWCRVFDLMIRRDSRTEGEIAAMIQWSQDDDFWQGNILSPDKLRKQFSQLYLAARKEGAALTLGGNE